MTEIKPLSTELSPDFKAMIEWLEYCEKWRRQRFDELFYIPNFVIIKPKGGDNE